MTQKLSYLFAIFILLLSNASAQPKFTEKEQSIMRISRLCADEALTKVGNPPAYQPGHGSDAGIWVEYYCATYTACYSAGPTGGWLSTDKQDIFKTCSDCIIQRCGYYNVKPSRHTIMMQQLTSGLPYVPPTAQEVKEHDEYEAACVNTAGGVCGQFK